MLIGIGIAFYFVLPLAIVAVDGLLIESYKFNGKSLYELEAPISVTTCDEWNTESVHTGGSVGCPTCGASNLEKANSIFDSLQPYLKQNLAVLFIRGVFLPVVALMLMIISIRVLTALGGAEIDVSLLSKIA